MILALLLAASTPDGAVVLESTTAAFTPGWELALDGGRVVRRPLHGGWHVLPPDGVPVPSPRVEVMKELVVPLVRAFEPATRLVELSADGDNLIVVDDRRRVYYAKLGFDPTRVGTWADTWGPPGFAAPLALPDDTIAWAISHRAQPYEDIDGNVHPISAGVTTLYALFPPDPGGHGSRIAYQDPWLPPPSTTGARWEREVCPPERGALTLIALAASASTIAVMDDGGRVHTRLADFDTMGHNPALLYSWHRARRTGLEENVRSLPAEEWRLQPRIPGKHTAALTVFFTGAAADGAGGANARRRLRVGGEGGHWEKELLDASWRFVPHAVKGAKGAKPASGGGAPVAFVEDREPTRGAPRGERLETRIQKALVEIDGFDLQCPGAPVRVSRDGEEVRLTLWHTERLLELDRREHDLRGALIVEGDPRGKLADDVRSLFEGDTVHEVEVDVHERYVEVKSAAADLKKLKRPLKVRLQRARSTQ